MQLLNTTSQKLCQESFSFSKADFPDGHPSLPLFKKRKTYHHDFRWGIEANQKELIKAAKWIGNILKETHPKNLIILIPLGGWSYPGEQGREFDDPKLTGLFVKWIKKFYKKTL
jgi:uncharacterized protein (UPF0261 family)